MTLVAAALAGLLAVYRDANVAWGWFALAARRHRARAHGQQPHERPVRPRGRHRPRRLPAQPLLAAPGALGRDHPQGPRGVRARRQRAVPRDHDRAHRRAGLADRRVRARRLPALGRVHRAAAAAEEARPRRADRARGVGPADGRRRLLRGDRHDPGRGRARVAAVRAALHDRAHGQAHRQDPVGRARRHAHAARDHGRGRGPPADPGDVRRVLRLGRRAGDRAGAARSRRCWCCCRSRCCGARVALLAAEARRVADAEPGVAAVVRGACRSS